MRITTPHRIAAAPRATAGPLSKPEGAQSLDEKILAELDAEPGPLEWPIGPADLANAYSLMLEIGEEEYLHHPFID